VFTDTDGGWLRKSNFIRNVYDPIRKAAELPRLPFHGLRHFHASYQVELGPSIKVLQERLGHADVGTTLRFYVHTREEAHRQAAGPMTTARGSLDLGRRPATSKFQRTEFSDRNPSDPQPDRGVREKLRPERPGGNY
jgi:hypothetical protein